MKNLTIILALLFISGFTSNSQDTIIRLDGKFIDGKVCNIDNEYVNFEIQKGKKLQYKKISIEDLFAIQYKDSSFSIIYSKDTSKGYYYSVDEMYSYVLGENYASNYYHAPLSTIGGFVTGIAGGVVGFWGFTIPTGYTMLTGSADPLFVKDKPLPVKQDINQLAGMVNINYKSGYASHISPELSSDDPILLQKPFYEGYNAKAKDKKTKNAIKGGIIGFATLVASSYILLSLQ